MEDQARRAARLDWCQISAVETTCEDDPNGLSDVVFDVRRMGWNYNAILFGLGLEGLPCRTQSGIT